MAKESQPSTESESYAALKVELKVGIETFMQDGHTLELTLQDFWKWALSDLVVNTSRGVLAEYVVAMALGITDTGLRKEWASIDLTTLNGTTVEVKTSAYWQSWGQEKRSAINFGIRPTREVIEGTAKYRKEAKRHADVYVFCLLDHEVKVKLNPLDLDQWGFYVLPTYVLDQEFPLDNSKSTGTISLSKLKKLEPRQASYGELNACVELAAQEQKERMGNDKVVNSDS